MLSKTDDNVLGLLFPKKKRSLIFPYIPKKCPWETDCFDMYQNKRHTPLCWKV